MYLTATRRLRPQVQSVPVTCRHLLAISLSVRCIPDARDSSSPHSEGCRHHMSRRCISCAVVPSMEEKQRIFPI
ncbi:hypothetical protein PIB30_014078 [Stylosanthes scabra]|uniref:Uncharacterized protein n=1 Tax=Stylosanthes scabra TaxID=79078 RepID=A0ABU6R6Y9_9FABA|nr:hypothetical protein [Stylosanthes scabra]